MDISPYPVLGGKKYQNFQQREEIMKNTFFIILVSVITIIGISTMALAQAYAPGNANAMGTKPQKQPPVQQKVAAPEQQSHKATFGRPIVVPWKRGGTYKMADVEKALQSLGWWISKAKNNEGQFYNPPKLELVAINDEMWKILKKDLHMQAVTEFGRGVEIKENDKDTPLWQHYLFRGGIQGIRAGVVDIVPPHSAR